MKPITLVVLFTIMILLTCLLFSELSVAQAPPALPGSGTPPMQSPIDGGLALLAAAGVAYAVKKLRERKE